MSGDVCQLNVPNTRPSADFFFYSLNKKPVTTGNDNYVSLLDLTPLYKEELVSIVNLWLHTPALCYDNFKILRIVAGTVHPI